jgi:hypothetical protein
VQWGSWNELGFHVDVRFLPLKATINKLIERGCAVEKSRKPNTTRKPPEPVENHTDIDDWMRRVMPDLKPIVEQLDEVICRELSGLQFAVKWKRAFYRLPTHGWIIEMAPYDVSVNVVFLGGANFDRPPPLGDVGQSRYVKLKTLEDTKLPEVRDWIKQAGRVTGWKIDS